MDADLTTLIPWLSTINFSVNFSKTKFILFKTPRINTSNIFYKLDWGSDTIFSTTNYEYLGLSVDEWMNWSSHITKVSHKIFFFVYQLRKIRASINSKALYMIYSAYIKSHLAYLIPIWGSAAKVHINCLQILQNKAIKFINFLPHHTHSADLYDSRFLSIQQLYNYESSFLIHKMRHNLIRCNVPLIPNISVTGRNTRSASLLRIPQFLTPRAQRTVFYNGLQQYNALPISIKNLTAISQFKSALKNYVSSNSTTTTQT